jgi:predicted ATPase/DNA-binding SARP family transcriptional activator
VLEFGILGPLEVRADGRAVPLGGARPRAVLAVLALHANQPVSAERLAVALWGEDAPPSAVKTVQVYVARLRKAIGDPDALVTTPAGYRLRVRPGELDAEHFERLVADGREALLAGRAEDAAVSLREALELWRGPPLAELASAPFAPAEIARLEEECLTALEVRVEADLAAGRHAELVGELQLLTGEHPWRERLHAQRMLALYRSGRQVDALEAYRHARDVLVDQLGIEPGPELHDLHESILVHDAVLDTRTASNGLRQGAVAVGGLPAPPNATIGRDREVAEVGERLSAGEVRLLTLTGPGGVGKTRLALAAAARVAAQFPDGAYFVSLAPLADPAELAAAIAVALGVPVQGKALPIEAVLRFLAGREALLVLDNFEHLLAGAPLPADLLARCPGLTILATSREPLRVAAERLYPVDPLAVPPKGDAPLPGDHRYPSVALFLERAVAHDPDFRLDRRSAPHIHHVCRRLDGLPLALELAAARVGMLEADELAERLDGALALLTAGARDAPARQRTLRAAIDWSYELLNDAERRAFGRMALFPGGVELAVAEQVTEASIDELDSLASKQLVVRRARRLSMLETIREYALEKLDDDPGADVVRGRLARWCIALAGETAPKLRTRDRTSSQARLDREMPNVRAALSWAIDKGRHDDALRLVAELRPYWAFSVHWPEGLRWTEAALERSEDASPPLRAAALLAWAQLAGPRRGERFRASLEQARALFAESGDDAGVAWCLAYLAKEQAWYGDGGEGIAEEALEHANRSGDPNAIAAALAARVNGAADFATAAQHAPAAIRQAQAVGDLERIASLCSNVGYEAIVSERYEEALRWLDEGLNAADEWGSQDIRYIIRGNQGVASLLLGELTAAASELDEALELCHEVAGEEVVDEVLLATAALAADASDLPRVARLAAAAERHQPLRSRHEQQVSARLYARVERARSRADSHEWESAEREGAQLNVSDAIAAARSALTAARQVPSAPGPADALS